MALPALVTGAAVGLGAYGLYRVIARKATATAPSGAAKPIAKAVAVDAVRKASRTTPHPTLGLDPNMTTHEVSRVNHALQQGTEPAGLFQLAGDLFDAGHTQSAEAVTAKAQAIDAAKVSGVSDADIFHAMMTAGTTSSPGAAAAAAAPSGPTYSADPAMDLAMMNANLQKAAADMANINAQIGASSSSPGAFAAQASVPAPAPMQGGSLASVQTVGYGYGYGVRPHVVGAYNLTPWG